MPEAYRTINDYSAQWTRYPENDGYYASPEMFADICGPLISTHEIQGLVTADLGAGTGRVVNMLLGLGAAKVTAVEPSAAFQALRNNTAAGSERVVYINETADRLPDGPYDLIVSFGVLDHIQDPRPIAHRAFDVLKPGGRMLIWVYGKEGNQAYLVFARPVRAITRLLPDPVLAGVCHVLTGFLSFYAWPCRFIPLPMYRYMQHVIGRYGWKHRFLTVFDQLNPTFAKYFTQSEARDLLEHVGFTDVTLYHRHGYSWTVSGRKRA
jgi:SAM-dependent methyltransferase